MADIKNLMMCLFAILIQRAGLSHGWSEARATFYGGNDAFGPMGDACGYGNLYNNGYAANGAALSRTLFNNGAICGACYEIKCDAKKDPHRCFPGTSIIVTATNYCPPNYALPSENGGWCNPPLEHFDMASLVFDQIAQYRGGIVPVLYRRVPCKRRGGIRFTINGRENSQQVLISNVGGRGEIIEAWIKGSTTKWQQMSSYWGANWRSNLYLKGQSLSFALISSNEAILTIRNVVPANWRFGQTFVSSRNFR